MSRSLLPALIAAAAVLAIAGCGGGASDTPAAEQRRQVAAAFYPLEEAARAIGGKRAEVIGLTPPGQGPHDLELGAPELRAIEDADLSFFLGSGFQPQVEQAVRASDGQAVDLLDAATLRSVDAPVRGVRGEIDGEVVAGDRDPHVWVDPALFLRVVDAIEAAYVSSDPAGRDLYERNARRYREGIEALDRAFAQGLGECETRTLVTSHAAFGYLADRYELEQAPIAGISPDDEPDPRSLAATARRAEADGVRTVFFESLVPPDLAETVASEIGADTSFLDPVEGLTREDLEAGSTYASVMRENLERLRKGLGCTG
jgi:zinc transport system substrate-binding protein